MAELDLRRLEGRKLFVGTPMYDGKCHSQYAFAIAELTALCTTLGINLRFYFACHQALITKARNVTVDEFLRAGDEHLMFIDADIGFKARDVIQLLALQVGDEARRYDVIAAPYPSKRLAWDKVLLAAKAGLADADPALLARYSSVVQISPANERTFPVSKPVEVVQAGTGFMMIRRDTFARYREHHKGRGYRSAEIGLEAHSSPELQGYFETEIDSKQGHMLEEARAYLANFPKATPQELIAFLESDMTMGRYSNEHVSEDYAFCRRVRDAGMKVWLCPWMELTHMGNHEFNSRLADLSAIGAA